jgi:hypothetical protein
MKLPLALSLLLLSAVTSHANALSDFQARVQPAYIKPFALDLGGILGGASAHTGRSLGTPGFWAGVVGSVQMRPDKDNRILRDSGVKSFGLPMLEVGVGLPLNFDIIVHGVRAYDATIYGGGVRFCAFRTGVVTTALPNVSISAFGDKVNHKHFSATHAAANAVATWNLPIVKPFALAGFDVTKVTVGSAATPGVSGQSATARGTRFSAGVDVHPLPLISLRGAYTLRHGIPGFDFGLGAQF